MTEESTFHLKEKISRLLKINQRLSKENRKLLALKRGINALADSLKKKVDILEGQIWQMGQRLSHLDRWTNHNDLRDQAMFEMFRGIPVDARAISFVLWMDRELLESNDNLNVSFSEIVNRMLEIHLKWSIEQGTSLPGTGATTFDGYGGVTWRSIK